MRHWARTLLWLLAATIILVAACLPASAFDMDAHYYLKYTLARAIGYTGEDAEKIASADQAVDENENTKPGLFRPDQNKKYHAFGTPAENNAREDELKQAVKDEPNRDKKLAKLGMLLHFVEDRYAHEGTTPIQHGINSVNGNCPDSMATNPQKTRDMILDSLGILEWAAPLLGVVPVPATTVWGNAKFQKMVNDLIANSRADWYVPFSPSTKKRIINGNKGIMEGYLGQSIPEPLVVKYDADGDPIKIGTLEYVYIDPFTYQGDVQVTSMVAVQLPSGQMSVEVDLVNAGTAMSVPGDLTVMSIDRSTGLSVGQADIFVNWLAVGETFTPVAIVGAAPVLSNTYIAASVDVDDRDASSGDWMFWYGPVLASKLSTLRSVPAGAYVSLTQPKVATVCSAAFADHSYYVEEPSRACGMKVVVNLAFPTVNEGDSVKLSGAMRMDANGEKYLLVSWMNTPVSHGLLGALGVTNRSLSTAHGLLVRGWGQVTELGPGYFVMCDGSGAPVNVVFDRLVNPVNWLPGVGQYVTVTGLSGLLGMETHTVPAIRPRSEWDIHVVP